LGLAGALGAALLAAAGIGLAILYRRKGVDGSVGNVIEPRPAKRRTPFNDIIKNIRRSIWENKWSIAGGAAANMAIKAAFSMTAASILAPVTGAIGVTLATGFVGGLGSKLIVKTFQNRSKQTDAKSTWQAFKAAGAEVCTAKGVAAGIGFGIAGAVAGDLIKMGWDHFIHHADAVSPSIQAPKPATISHTTNPVVKPVDAPVVAPKVISPEDLRAAKIELHNLKETSYEQIMQGKKDAAIATLSKGKGLIDKFDIKDVNARMIMRDFSALTSPAP
jgi:hypothetical protein